MDRRAFLRDCAAGTLVTAAAASGAGSNSIRIDPQPLFDISPYLYMQFMEPLGTTDASVEGAWDWDADDWRQDFVATTRDLAPDVMRFGGLFASYYKWREGIGPAQSRTPMRNYVWGGRESNRVGTHEFVDFCRRAGAHPLICVNFLAEGKRRFRHRAGDAREAADWVSYCNDPDHPERTRNGAAQPYNVKLWQIGNETSYGREGFTRQEAIAHTIEFAKAMRARDPSVELIGWGDRGDREGGTYWAGDMLQQAGEHLNYIAVHAMDAQRPKDPNSVIRTWAYQQQPETAWEELRRLSGQVQALVEEVEQIVAARNSGVKIAITEGHLSLMHNVSPLLCEWLTGAYHARVMNIYQRHGDKVKIATGADFAGNRWTVNAVILAGSTSYLMPGATVMRLFKRVNGKQAVAVKSCPADLDIAASRTGGTIYLHVANMNYSRAVEASFDVEGLSVTGGTAHEIAPENPREYIDMDRPNVFAPKEKAIGGPALAWRFPARSVTAIELVTA